LLARLGIKLCRAVETDGTMSLSDAESAEPPFGNAEAVPPADDDARPGRGWRMLIPLALVAIVAGACWGVDQLSFGTPAPTPAPPTVQAAAPPPAGPAPIAATSASPPTLASDTQPPPSADLALATPTPDAQPAPVRAEAVRRSGGTRGRRHAVLAVDAGASGAEADAAAPTIAAPPAAPPAGTTP
jgi:hypothetical protein